MVICITSEDFKKTHILVILTLVILSFWVFKIMKVAKINDSFFKGQLTIWSLGLIWAWVELLALLVSLLPVNPTV